MTDSQTIDRLQQFFQSPMFTDKLSWAFAGGECLIITPCLTTADRLWRGMPKDIRRETTISIWCRDRLFDSSFRLLREGGD